MIGTDPSWRQVIDLAATIASSPDLGPDRRRARNRQVAPGPLDPFARAQPRSTIHHRGVIGNGRRAVEPRAASAPAVGPRGNDFGIGLTSWPKPTAAQSILTEVAALPLACQHHLFRELQFRDYEAEHRRIPCPGRNARFVMSTSENLPALIEQGRLRQELYHRISVISLMLPPLRHRGTDVELLAESFRAHYAREFHKTVAGFTRDALDVLQKHDWPGNVRELEAAVKRAVALCNGPRSPRATWRPSSTTITRRQRSGPRLGLISNRGFDP